MRLPLLVLFSLPFGLATSLLHKQKQLVELAAAGNGVIQLDDETFSLVTSPSRNWSVAVHFTAMDPRRRCTPCKEFDPSWNAVAQAWTKTPQKDRDSHFFATIDFDDGQHTFQKLSLTSAPVVFVYHPTEGPRQPTNGKYGPLKFDFSSGFDPQPLAEQLSTYTPVPIPYKAPIDWSRWGIIATGILSLLFTIRFIAPVLKSRWTWAAITVITSLIMTSGYMYTRIRGSPYSGPGGQWIAAGYQSQFGQEVHVVAAIYGLLAISFLMLTIVIPYQQSRQRQRAQVYLWTTIILIVYSILVSLFRMKNRGYPFKLFF